MPRDDRMPSYYSMNERQAWEAGYMAGAEDRKRYGSRLVTKRDRDLAIKRELLDTTSSFRLTPGMIQHLRNLRNLRTRHGLRRRR